MSSKSIELVSKLGFAIIFAVLFCLLLTFTPLGLFFRPLDCWDWQEDFVLSNNQIALTLSALLTFFGQSLLKTGGWKGFFKKIVVSYLCFQVFSVVSIYSTIYVQHCYFPMPLAEIFKAYWMKILIVSSVESGAAAFLCILTMFFYERLLAILFPDKDDPPTILPDR